MIRSALPVVLLVVVGPVACAPNAYDPGPVDLTHIEHWEVGFALDLAPPAMVLSSSDWTAGETVNVTATGADAGDLVRFFRGGPGVTCPPPLGGDCLDIADASPLGTGVADISGTATLDFTLPPTVAEGTFVQLQALVLNPGAANAYSNVVSAFVGSVEACAPGEVLAETPWPEWLIDQDAITHSDDTLFVASAYTVYSHDPVTLIPDEATFPAPVEGNHGMSYDPVRGVIWTYTLVSFPARYSQMNDTATAVVAGPFENLAHTAGGDVDHLGHLHVIHRYGSGIREYDSDFTDLGYWGESRYGSLDLEFGADFEFAYYTTTAGEIVKVDFSDPARPEVLSWDQAYGGIEGTADDLTVGAYDVLYIADSGNDRVVAYDADGAELWHVDTEVGTEPTVVDYLEMDHTLIVGFHNDGRAILRKYCIP